MARALLSQSTIVGEVKAYAGATAPTGYLLCYGQAVSRADYADLFTILGTTYGSGDGSTTFNLPDYRGNFLRGAVNVDTVTGSGTAASNNATFTSHGLNRTGFKVRLSSGTLSGLTTATDYYVIVVDSNTLAFATSYANAIAGTKIAITGANSAVIMQYEDPDKSSRTSNRQDDAFKSHHHNVGTNANFNASGVSGGNFQSGTINNLITGSTGGNETRPKNVTINYIIKY